MRGIEDGYIVGTVVQDPFGFGYHAVKAMAEIAKGETSQRREGARRAAPDDYEGRWARGALRLPS